jgi:hypothetical protein
MHAVSHHDAMASRRRRSSRLSDRLIVVLRLAISEYGSLWHDRPWDGFADALNHGHGVAL